MHSFRLPWITWPGRPGGQGNGRGVKEEGWVAGEVKAGGSPFFFPSKGRISLDFQDTLSRARPLRQETQSTRPDPT